MRDRNCEVCKADLSFARVAECSVSWGVHTILCQSCRTTMDRRIMALPQWRRVLELDNCLTAAIALAQSGLDTRPTIIGYTGEKASLEIELHDIIVAMLGRTATT